MVISILCNTGGNDCTTHISTNNATAAEIARPAVALNLEIVRRACLAVVSNQLIENTQDGELLAWFLATQIREIVQCMAEPQEKLTRVSLT